MKIAIASGKGGTGKTTLSTNFAAYLSQTRPVLLTDLDVEEPNSGVFISGQLVHSEIKYKMIPQWSGDCSLCGLCHEVCNFNAVIQLADQILIFPELCHSCYACSELCPESALPMIPQAMGELKHYVSEQLNFVDSRLHIGQEQAVPLIAQTKKYIQAHFDPNTLQIFDAPPGTSCPLIEAVKDADFVILVTEPTPFGLHDLKLSVDTMRQLNKEFGVVVNRDGIGNDHVLTYCQNEQLPVLAQIPNDRQIAELYSRGRLLYNEVAEVRKQLDSIIEYLQLPYNGGTP
ncbi:MAG: P-loop NTPase [Caldithrix sp.]|nr:P-loop NTPase [Caldithrix sp.]